MTRVVRIVRRGKQGIPGVVDATALTSTMGTFSDVGVTNGTRFAPVSFTLDSSRSLTSSLNHQRFYNPNGQVGGVATNGTATVFATSSDVRMKGNRAPAVIDVDAILSALDFETWDWLRWRNGGWEETGDRGIGLIAQDVHAVLLQHAPDLIPMVVSIGAGEPGDEEFCPWALDYGKLGGILALLKLKSMMT